jgi:hypothetical protein
MACTLRHLAVGSSVLLLALVLPGCGDSAHTLGSTGGGGRGGASAGAGGTTSAGGVAGGGSGGAVAGGGGPSGAIGTGGTGAGATGGTGGAAGRGGAGGVAGSGNAGGAAGRGGAGGVAGSGNTGGAAGCAGRGGMGGVGTGGAAGITGTGGVAVVACLTVQTLDRSCTTDADCFAAMNIADCCGRLQYIGLRTTQQNIYTGLEQQCQMTWPACTCVTRATILDDGSTIKNGMSAGVTCRQGVCTTFVPACGGPCAAGLTCFSCQISGGQYGACTTPCTDVTASSDCSNTSLPRCQMGQSGNVDGTYCTAANVMCDVRTPPPLTDCAGLVCGSSQQSVKVRNPALGTNQCACVDMPSTGRCTDCTCGESLCSPFGAHCVGFALEGGLLCTLNG